MLRSIVAIIIFHLWMVSPVHSQTEPHWEDFVIFGAGYMGPNALPIPAMNKGRIDNQNSVQMSGMAYFSEGEQTYALNATANVAVVKDLVSFDLFWVPVEYFQMSEALRAQRVVLAVKGDQQFAIGDVYLNSTVQIIDKPRFHASARAGFKFPSSNGVALSRFTDSPGYNLDAGFGYLLHQNAEKEVTLDLHGMAGFYSYQTQGGYANYRQNDAVLLGIGLDYIHPNWMASISLRSYLGYFDLLDQPAALRAQFSRDFENIRFFTALQFGIQDLIYVAPEVGIGILLPEVNMGQRNR